MASTCACKGCSGKVVTRMQARLDQIQRLMLGFFCAKCILLRCDHECKKKK